MPTPGKNESQKDFISRCIPIVIGEGVEKDQATARCYSIWRRSKGIKDAPPKKKKSATDWHVARATK